MQYPIDCWFLKIAYDWQTLLAGALAFIGALWTVVSIRAQIKQAELQAEGVRKREEFASKAILPLALSQISRYAQDCIELLNPLTIAPQARVGPEMKAPRVPDNVVAVLQQSARYAEEKIATRIAALLGKIQVQQSRIGELLHRRSGEPIIVHEGVSNIIDAADVYARTGELFDYARDIEETRRRAPLDLLRRALHNCGIWDDDHPAMTYIDNLEQNRQDQ